MNIDDLKLDKTNARKRDQRAEETLKLVAGERIP